MSQTPESIEKDIIKEIKMVEENDDLNANYLSKEKELIKELFSRIEEINGKIREICIKASLNTEECGFDQQKYEGIKYRQGITKRLSVLSQTLFTNENGSSSNSRRNLSKEQTLLMLPKLECVKFSGVNKYKPQYGPKYFKSIFSRN